GIGLVDEPASGSEQARQGGEMLAQQNPADDDEIEADVLRSRPGKRVRRGFAAEGKVQGRREGALLTDGQAFVGDVGEGDTPATLSQPESVTAGASGEIESAGGGQGS